MLLFDEELMTFAMGNCITLEDTNGNRKLLKKRYEQKIDAVAAMMDAYVAYKLNKDEFDSEAFHKGFAVRHSTFEKDATTLGRSR